MTSKYYALQMGLTKECGYQYRLPLFWCIRWSCCKICSFTNKNNRADEQV